MAERPPKFGTIRALEVEHGLAERGEGFVKVRVIAEDGSILLGRITPDDARETGKGFAETAARADYEADLYNGLKSAEMDDKIIGFVLHTIRGAEAERREPKGGADG